MRALITTAAALLLVAGGIDATAHASTATTAPPTVRVVVRPVTAAGHARAGFTVTNEATGQVDCSPPGFASPAAVNNNIAFCSPSAEYAVACWKAAWAHHVLCMRNPRVKKVVRIPRTGSFAPVTRPTGAATAPLAMRLGNGAFCTIRDGGAWGTLHSHPQWVGTYSCDNGSVVWAAPSAPHQGVNESSASWTVHTAPASGVGTVIVRHVTKAWFVGTFFG